ncbi:uncharacterized protein BDR25DRAFT_351022 [Lindgomyces ingoldianus]|uniref:Uncharacterized protein n=1 Tax=Lindgomyces ingoldianus TaxID=673940 RepID=A0ACB6R6V5_9PLEO|nr:uncharacterized protein BDR25DRAFT_351022 [Lindgomyces ingoldianus]KAF2474505.1 hypothetical protein BDR25DRAFT_351022 [Lindgomyces ingoldianus]
MHCCTQCAAGVGMSSTLRHMMEQGKDLIRDRRVFLRRVVSDSVLISSDFARLRRGTSVFVVSKGLKIPCHNMPSRLPALPPALSKAFNFLIVVDKLFSLVLLTILLFLAMLATHLNINRNTETRSPDTTDSPNRCSNFARISDSPLSTTFPTHSFQNSLFYTVGEEEKAKPEPFIHDREVSISFTP